MTTDPRPDPWIVMPVIDCVDMTLQAVEDCLAQVGLSGPPKLLLIDNGSTRENRRAYEVLQEAHPRQVYCWFHNPPLGEPPTGSLSATWNMGLDFCWNLGCEEVLVVNNDVRLHRDTYWQLRDILLGHSALFVSAVGVTEEQFDPEAKHCFDPMDRGGPDFSCFLISRGCHHRFRFDEQFTYFNDNDYHRRLILAGEGHRIFSVNVPYLHYGSATINRSPEAKEAYHKVFELHRERYIEKWGGVPHQETFGAPYDAEAANSAGPTPQPPSR